MEPKLGLRTCVYKVTDLAAAKAWYADLFQVEPNFDESFYVGFTVGGFELGLMPDEMDPATKTSNVLTYWGVKNVQKAFDEFLEKGATVDGPIVNVGGDIWVAELKDPWGNVIGIIDNPAFDPKTSS